MQSLLAITPDRRGTQPSRALDAAASQYWRSAHQLTDSQVQWAREYFARDYSLVESARLAKLKTEGVPC